MYAQSTNGTPQIILLLSEDTPPPRVTLLLIHFQSQTVPVLVVHFALAVPAHMQDWPHFLLVYGFFSATNASVNIGGDGSIVTTWAVTEYASCFVIALILFSFLLVLVTTTLAK